MAIDEPGRIGRREVNTREDEVLREVARIVDECSQGMGKPGRWGTEEIAVVLPETGVEAALELAERLRAAIELADLPLPEHRAGERVTVSVGIGTLARFGGRPIASLMPPTPHSPEPEPGWKPRHRSSKR